jgi:peptidyl-prolyl cis-trans isomerase D
MMRRLLVLVALSACGPGIKGGPTMNNSLSGPEPGSAPTSDVISADILAREPLANIAKVQHILIGWKDLDAARDPRAQARTKQQAEADVKTVLGQIKAGTSFEDLMKQYSEDPGSASTGRAYDVSPDAQLVIEFKQLGLRLHVGEVGVVASDYGFHIIKRTE